MPPPAYILHVNSRPTKVSEKVWKQWYTTEHLPDLVTSGTSTRATLHEEIDLPGPRGTDNPRRYLALYQTDFAQPLLTESYKGLRKTSELFEESETGEIGENGDFDARNYELIQTFDPNQVGEVPPPEIITAEMHPKDPDDLDKWYREEHLGMLSKLPGYRRTLRYKLGPKTALTKGDDPPLFLAVHEVDDAVKALSSRELEETNSTPWTQKHISESDPFVARGWRLVHSEGF